MTIYQGVDASSYQGTIDWRRVRSFHTDFAILRATMGWGKPEVQIDRQFHRNIHDATEAGLLTGAYHTTLATSPDAAHREAEFFINTIRGYKLAYPTAIDVGDRSLRYLSNQKLDAVIRAWCGDLREAGYYPMICADLQTATERLYPETIGEYDLWLIKPGETTDYDGDVGLWRYSVSDSVDGVHTRIGRNRSLRDFPAIMRQRGLGGFAAPENPVRVEEPASLFSPSSPLMQAFETLSGLASFIDIMKLLFENDELAKKLLSNQPVSVHTPPPEPVPDTALPEPAEELPAKPSEPAVMQEEYEQTAEKPDDESDEDDTPPPPEGSDDSGGFISGEQSALLDKVLEDEAVPDSMTDQQDIAAPDYPQRRRRFKNPEDDDIQDEVENRLEARWIHGRWAWLLA
jgi:GH25 family lysozyme M1 (1,4-beta-N-acetylmuramidase)